MGVHGKNIFRQTGTVQNMRFAELMAQTPGRPIKAEVIREMLVDPACQTVTIEFRQEYVAVIRLFSDRLT